MLSPFETTICFTHRHTTMVHYKGRGDDADTLKVSFSQPGYASRFPDRIGRKTEENLSKIEKPTMAELSHPCRELSLLVKAPANIIPTNDLSACPRAASTNYSMST